MANPATRLITLIILLLRQQYPTDVELTQALGVKLKDI